MTTSDSTSRKIAGFTLVEVTLALMVVAVGCLAVLGLFPSAMRAVKAATDETRIVGFADEVFNSFRAIYGTEALAAYTNTPVSVSLTLPDMASQQLLDTSDVRPRPNSNRVETNVYIYGFGIGDSFINYEYGVRYKLDVVDSPPSSMYLRLAVWPGEFGQPPAGTSDGAGAYNEDDAYIFYTEMHRYGE
ncbi:MAG: hypothetical protein KJ626_05385 [Verrucomicrobia bacterium]|nr:hypothetical protein [Verrucomicrobiota bacterium]